MITLVKAACDVTMLKTLNVSGTSFACNSYFDGSNPNFSRKVYCNFEKLVELLSSIERLVLLHLFAVLREECDSRVYKSGDEQVGVQMFHAMMLKISKRAKSKKVSQTSYFFVTQHASSSGFTMRMFKTKIRELFHCFVHNVFCVICRHRLLGVWQMLQRDY